MDGVVGQSLLTDHEAVIDFARPAMYIRDPIDRTGSRLRGEWVGVAGERDGAKIPDIRKWSITFAGNERLTLRHAERKGETESRALFVTYAGHQVLAAVAKDNATDLPLFDQVAAVGVFAVTGDRLKYCFSLPDGGANRKVSATTPTTFDSAAGTRCVTLEFERVGKKPPQPEPLARLLFGQGYTELPLERSPADGSFHLVLAVGEEKVRFHLDTGASGSHLEPSAVRRLRLQARDGNVTLPEPRHGRFEFPSFNARVSPAVVTGPKPAEGLSGGLLGHDVLAHLSAVFDCEKPALYVISPLDREWPGLKGEWLCSSGTRDGKPLADADQWRFHFGEKGKARLSQANGDVTTSLGVDFRFSGRHRVMTLTRAKSDKPVRLPFEQEAIWMQYAVSGDTLKVAFLLHPKDTAVLADRVPPAIASKAGSGVVALEFTRQPKPPEKK